MEGDLITYKKTRFLVPRRARKSIIMLAHDEHTGIYGITTKIRGKYYWPHLQVDMEEYLKSCKDCYVDPKEVD